MLNNYKQEKTDSVGGGVIYYGQADPGTPTTSRKWSIWKETTTGADIVKQYPAGAAGVITAEEKFAWDERLTLGFADSDDLTAPTLTTVTIASDNADTTKAKVGDTVTITIAASEYIKNVVGTINGHTATVTEVDDQNFTIAYDMVEADTNGLVTFSIGFSDIGDRPGVNVTAVTSGSGVTFDKTAPTATLEYSVDAGSTWATTIQTKNADTLRIRATFSEALLDSPIVKLAINNSILSATNMTKTSTTVYYYDLNVPAGDVATATCSLSVGTDGAGNVVTAAPTNATFTVDNTAPTMSSAVRISDTELEITTSELIAALTIAQANDGGFVVTETGGVPTYTVTAVAAGATNDKIRLTVASMAASSVAGVTITYVAAGNGILTDRA